MFCSRCGQPLNGNIVCPNCGQNNISNEKFQDTEHYILTEKFDSTFKSQIIIAVCISCSIIIIAFVYLTLTSDSNKVYFSDDNNVNEYNKDQKKDDVSKTIGVTSISHDNSYTIYVPTTESVVLDKIKEDSVSQKDSCSSKIIEIERKIIANYKIPAVNLCELDVDFALELEKVVGYIYNNYPTARGYLTNLSLGNIDNNSSTIAFFQWVSLFTVSTEDNLLGYKTRIILNSAYYLNEARFESAISNSVLSGHFPQNATKYSPLAHEFGHYLSFIAVNKYYSTSPRSVYDSTNLYAPYMLALNDYTDGTLSKKMLDEAYQNYKQKSNTTLTFDEFRATISGYAMAKDDKGEYIYDETIAEAFHDVYLNGDNAVDASKEIVSVLEKYLEM